MTAPQFKAGDRVYHAGQIWARSLPGGTATVQEVLGPYNDGSYEYKVLATEQFARAPGPDNPETRPVQWSSFMTRTAYKGEK